MQKSLSLTLFFPLFFSFGMENQFKLRTVITITSQFLDGSWFGWFIVCSLQICRRDTCRHAAWRWFETLLIRLLLSHLSPHHPSRLLHPSLKPKYTNWIVSSTRVDYWLNFFFYCYHDVLISAAASPPPPEKSEKRVDEKRKKLEEALFIATWIIYLFVAFGVCVSVRWELETIYMGIRTRNSIKFSTLFCYEKDDDTTMTLTALQVVVVAVRGWDMHPLELELVKSEWGWKWQINYFLPSSSSSSHHIQPKGSQNVFFSSFIYTFHEWVCVCGWVSSVMSEKT